MVHAGYLSEPIYRFDCNNPASKSLFMTLGTCMCHVGAFKAVGYPFFTDFGLHINFSVIILYRLLLIVIMVLVIRFHAIQMQLFE